MKESIIHIKKLSRQDIFASLIVVLAVFENISKPMHYLCAGLQILFAFELLFYLNENAKLVMADVLFLAGVIVFGILNICLVGQMDFPKLAKVISHFPVAVYLTENSIQRNTKYWGMVGKFVFFFILAWWFLFGEGEMLFHSASRNYVSIFLILALFLAALGDCRQKEMHIQPYYYWMLLGACVMAVGRNGIICALFINFSYYMYIFYLKPDRKKQNKIVLCIFGVVLFVVFALFILLNFNFIVSRYFSRFVDGTQIGSNTIRRSVIVSYWNSLQSPKHLLLGVDAASLSDFLKEAGGNLHCSYFMVQAAFGIIPFVIFLVSIVRTEKMLFQERRMELLILLTAFLLRVLTDTAFPNHLGDIAAWYIVLKPYHTYGKRKPVRFKIQTGA